MADIKDLVASLNTYAQSPTSSDFTADDARELIQELQGQIERPEDFAVRALAAARFLKKQNLLAADFPLHVKLWALPPVASSIPAAEPVHSPSFMIARDPPPVPQLRLFLKIDDETYKKMDAVPAQVMERHIASKSETPIFFAPRHHIWWMKMIERDIPLVGAQAIVDGGMVVYGRFQTNPADRKTVEAILEGAAKTAKLEVQVLTPQVKEWWSHLWRTALADPQTSPDFLAAILAEVKRENPDEAGYWIQNLEDAGEAQSMRASHIEARVNNPAAIPPVSTDDAEFHAHLDALTAMGADPHFSQINKQVETLYRDALTSPTLEIQFAKIKAIKQTLEGMQVDHLDAVVEGEGASKPVNVIPVEAPVLSPVQQKLLVALNTRTSQPVPDGTLWAFKRAVHAAFAIKMLGYNQKAAELIEAIQSDFIPGLNPTDQAEALSLLELVSKGSIRLERENEHTERGNRRDDLIQNLLELVEAGKWEEAITASLAAGDLQETALLMLVAKVTSHGVVQKRSVDALPGDVVVPVQFLEVHQSYNDRGVVHLERSQHEAVMNAIHSGGPPYQKLSISISLRGEFKFTIDDHDMSSLTMNLIDNQRLTQPPHAGDNVILRISASGRLEYLVSEPETYLQLKPLGAALAGGTGFVSSTTNIVDLVDRLKQIYLQFIESSEAQAALALKDAPRDATMNSFVDDKTEIFLGLFNCAQMLNELGETQRAEELLRQLYSISKIYTDSSGTGKLDDAIMEVRKKQWVIPFEDIVAAGDTSDDVVLFSKLFAKEKWDLAFQKAKETLRKDDASLMHVNWVAHTVLKKYGASLAVYALSQKLAEPVGVDYIIILDMAKICLFLGLQEASAHLIEQARAVMQRMPGVTPQQIQEEIDRVISEKLDKAWFESVRADRLGQAVEFQRILEIDKDNYRDILKAIEDGSKLGQKTLLQVACYVLREKGLLPELGGVVGVGAATSIAVPILTPDQQLIQKFLEGINLPQPDAHFSRLNFLEVAHLVFCHRILGNVARAEELAQKIKDEYIPLMPASEKPRSQKILDLAGQGFLAAGSIQNLRSDEMPPTHPLKNIFQKAEEGKMSEALDLVNRAGNIPQDLAFLVASTQPHKLVKVRSVRPSDFFQVTQVDAQTFNPSSAISLNTDLLQADGGIMISSGGGGSNFSTDLKEKLGIFLHKDLAPYDSNVKIKNENLVLKLRAGGEELIPLSTTFPDLNLAAIQPDDTILFFPAGSNWKAANLNQMGREITPQLDFLKRNLPALSSFQKGILLEAISLCERLTFAILDRGEHALPLAQLAFIFSALGQKDLAQQVFTLASLNWIGIRNTSKRNHTQKILLKISQGIADWNFRFDPTPTSLSTTQLESIIPGMSQILQLVVEGKKDEALVEFKAKRFEPEKEIECLLLLVAQANGYTLVSHLPVTQLRIHPLGVDIVGVQCAAPLPTDIVFPITATPQPTTLKWAEPQRGPLGATALIQTLTGETGKDVQLNFGIGGAFTWQVIPGGIVNSAHLNQPRLGLKPEVLAQIKVGSQIIFRPVAGGSFEVLVTNAATVATTPVFETTFMGLGAGLILTPGGTIEVKGSTLNKLTPLFGVSISGMAWLSLSSDGTSLTLSHSGSTTRKGIQMPCHFPFTLGGTHDQFMLFQKGSDWQMVNLSSLVREIQADVKKIQANPPPLSTPEKELLALANKAVLDGWIKENGSINSSHLADIYKIFGYDQLAQKLFHLAALGSVHPDTLRLYPQEADRQKLEKQLSFTSHGKFYLEDSSRFEGAYSKEPPNVRDILQNADAGQWQAVLDGLATWGGAGLNTLLVLLFKAKGLHPKEENGDTFIDFAHLVAVGAAVATGVTGASAPIFDTRLVSDEESAYLKNNQRWTMKPEILNKLARWIGFDSAAYDHILIFDKENRQIKIPPFLGLGGSEIIIYSNRFPGFDFHLVQDEDLLLLRPKGSKFELFNITRLVRDMKAQLDALMAAPNTLPSPQNLLLVKANSLFAIFLGQSLDQNKFLEWAEFAVVYEALGQHALAQKCFDIVALLNSSSLILSHISQGKAYSRYHPTADNLVTSELRAADTQLADAIEDAKAGRWSSALDAAVDSYSLLLFTAQANNYTVEKDPGGETFLRINAIGAAALQAVPTLTPEQKIILDEFLKFEPSLDLIPPQDMWVMTGNYSRRIDYIRRIGYLAFCLKALGGDEKKSQEFFKLALGAAHGHREAGLINVIQLLSQGIIPIEKLDNETDVDRFHHKIASSSHPWTAGRKIFLLARSQKWNEALREILSLSVDSEQLLGFMLLAALANGMKPVQVDVVGWKKDDYLQVKRAGEAADAGATHASPLQANPLYAGRTPALTADIVFPVSATPQPIPLKWSKHPALIQTLTGETGQDVQLNFEIGGAFTWQMIPGPVNSAHLNQPRLGLKPEVLAQIKAGSQVIFKPLANGQFDVWVGNQKAGVFDTSLVSGEEGILIEPGQSLMLSPELRGKIINLFGSQASSYSGELTLDEDGSLVLFGGPGRINLDVSVAAKFPNIDISKIKIHTLNDKPDKLILRPKGADWEMFNLSQMVRDIEAALDSLKTQPSALPSSQKELLHHLIGLTQEILKSPSLLNSLLTIAKEYPLRLTLSFIALQQPDIAQQIYNLMALLTSQIDKPSRKPQEDLLKEITEGKLNMDLGFTADNLLTDPLRRSFPDFAPTLELAQHGQWDEVSRQNFKGVYAMTMPLLIAQANGYTLVEEDGKNYLKINTFGAGGVVTPLRPAQQLILDAVEQITIQRTVSSSANDLMRLASLAFCLNALGRPDEGAKIFQSLQQITDPNIVRLKPLFELLSEGLLPFDYALMDRNNLRKIYIALFDADPGLINEMTSAVDAAHAGRWDEAIEIVQTLDSDPQRPNFDYQWATLIALVAIANGVTTVIHAGSTHIQVNQLPHSGIPASSNPLGAGASTFAVPQVGATHASPLPGDGVSSPLYAGRTPGLGGHVGPPLRDPPPPPAPPAAPVEPVVPKRVMQLETQVFDFDHLQKRVPQTAKEIAAFEKYKDYIPKFNGNIVLFPRFKKMLDEIARFVTLDARVGFQFFGPPGTSKTTIPEMIAAAMGVPLLRFPFNKKTEASDVDGAWTIMEIDGQAVPVFEEGAATIAMENGFHLIWDEPDMARPGVLTALNHLIEPGAIEWMKGRDGVVRPIKVHKDFRLHVTENGAEQAYREAHGEDFSGRFIPFYVGPWTEEEYTYVLDQLHGVKDGRRVMNLKLVQAMAKLHCRMIQLAQGVKETGFSFEGFGAKIGQDVEFTPRSLFRLAKRLQMEPLTPDSLFRALRAEYVLPLADPSDQKLAWGTIRANFKEALAEMNWDADTLDPAKHPLSEVTLETLSQKYLGGRKIRERAGFTWTGQALRLADEILWNWSQGIDVMVLGGSNEGKTKLITEIASILQVERNFIILSSKTNYRDLVGGLRLVGTRHQFVPGPLLKGVRAGGIVHFDEYLAADPGKMEGLMNPLLDDAQALFISAPYEKVLRYVDPINPMRSTHFAFTSNPAHGNFKGRYASSGAAMSRVAVIYLEGNGLKMQAADRIAIDKHVHQFNALEREKELAAAKAAGESPAVGEEGKRDFVRHSQGIGVGGQNIYLFIRTHPDIQQQFNIPALLRFDQTTGELWEQDVPREKGGVRLPRPGDFVPLKPQTQTNLDALSVFLKKKIEKEAKAKTGRDLKISFTMKGSHYTNLVDKSLHLNLLNLLETPLPAAKGVGNHEWSHGTIDGMHAFYDSFEPGRLFANVVGDTRMDEFAMTWSEGARAEMVALNNHYRPLDPSRKEKASFLSLLPHEQFAYAVIYYWRHGKIQPWIRDEDVKKALAEALPILKKGFTELPSTLTEEAIAKSLDSFYKTLDEAYPIYEKLLQKSKAELEKRRKEGQSLESLMQPQGIKIDPQQMEMLMKMLGLKLEGVTDPSQQMQIVLEVRSGALANQFEPQDPAKFEQRIKAVAQARADKAEGKDLAAKDEAPLLPPASNIPLTAAEEDQIKKAELLLLKEAVDENLYTKYLPAGIRAAARKLAKIMPPIEPTDDEGYFIDGKEIDPDALMQDKLKSVPTHEVMVREEDSPDTDAQFIFLSDISDSIVQAGAKENTLRASAALIALSEELKVNYGEMAFGHATKWIKPLKGSVGSIRKKNEILNKKLQAFDDPEINRGTNIALPLAQAVQTLGKTRGAAKYIVLLTDGESFSSDGLPDEFRGKSIQQIAAIAKKRGITVLALAMGEAKKHIPQLFPNNHRFVKDDGSDIVDMIVDLFYEIQLQRKYGPDYVERLRGEDLDRHYKALGQRAYVGAGLKPAPTNLPVGANHPEGAPSGYSPSSTPALGPVPGGTPGPQAMLVQGGQVMAFAPSVPVQMGSVVLSSGVQVLLQPAPAQVADESEPPCGDLFRKMPQLRQRIVSAQEMLTNAKPFPYRETLIQKFNEILRTITRDEMNRLIIEIQDHDISPEGIIKSVAHLYFEGKDALQGWQSAGPARRAIPPGMAPANTAPLFAPKAAPAATPPSIFH